ncbi:MAG: hypothetical protein HRT90_02875 [Candidatus Margulisbacteria bacterium]|nr:hypothetical protein [Candidatus Margulisiibacteriota bacterium]
MKINASLLFLIVLSAHCFSIDSYSVYPSRIIGMGGAFNAVTGDIETVFVNPAGVATLHKQSLNISYRNISPSSGDLFNLSYGVSVPIKIEKAILPITLFGNNVTAADIYQQNRIGVNFSFDFSQVLPKNKIFHILSIGSSIEYFSQSYMGDNEYSDVFAGGKYTAETYILNAGILLGVFLEDLNLSFTGKYINSPNIGISENNLILPSYIVGISYLFKLSPAIKLLTTIDAEYLQSSQFTFRVGLELGVGKYFLIRGGAEYLDSNFIFAFGLGIKPELKNNAFIIGLAFNIIPQMNNMGQGIHSLSATIGMEF